MIKRLETFLLCLFIVSIPIQLGKHFWPAFSFVSGIRVDYLSPTIYISDIIICALFIIFTLRMLVTQEIFSLRWRDQSGFIILCIPIMAFLVTGILLSHFPVIAWYGLLKILEFLFVGRYVALYAKSISSTTLSLLFQIETIIVSGIGIAQFYLQHSIEGIMYFLGERAIYSSTPGAATMSIYGQQVLRPYATFPHPNVFAFFLAFSLIMITQLPLPKNTIRKFIYILSLIVGTIALILTASRIMILSLVIFVLWVTYRKFKGSVKWIAGTIIIISVSLIIVSLSGRFSLDSLIRDWSFRTDLLQISLSIIRKHPVFGVGINNIFPYELGYQKDISATLLQPVHNIYIFVAAETGIVGLAMFLFFLQQTFKNGMRRRDQILVRPAIILLGIVIFAGLFDHYFVTLQQGQLLFVTILGLCWSKNSSSEE